MSRALCNYGMVILGELYALCTLTADHQDGSNNPAVPTRKGGHLLTDIRGHRVTAPYECAHCGRPCGNLEGGFAVIGGHRVCHPNVSGRPDCYRLITVYGEVIGVRQSETQQGYQQVKASTTGFLQRTLMPETKGK